MHSTQCLVKYIIICTTAQKLPDDLLKQFAIVESMCEKQLRNSQQIVHFEHLGTHLVVHALYFCYRSLLNTKEASNEGPSAGSTHIVKHLVSWETANLLQVLENGYRDKTPGKQRTKHGVSVDQHIQVWTTSKGNYSTLNMLKKHYLQGLTIPKYTQTLTLFLLRLWTVSLVPYRCMEERIREEREPFWPGPPSPSAHSH